VSCPWNDPHCSRCAEAATDDFFVALAETERKMEEDAMATGCSTCGKKLGPSAREDGTAQCSTCWAKAGYPHPLAAPDREPRDIRCTCGANGRIDAYHAKACPVSVGKREHPHFDLAIGEHVMLTSKTKPESQRAVYLGQSETSYEVRLRLVSGDSTLSAEVMFPASEFEWCAAPTEPIPTHEPVTARRGRTRLKPGATL
jgi:DNA-directed RNA polymerase subunit RPC12/RpoP